MGTWQSGQRPITFAILAMGGEGGAVLSNWVADTATANGWAAQTTQVAGVAQRTGATVYYVELFPPVPDAAGPRAQPVLSMFPIPGEVDVLIASELMEAGRAVQRGFVTPDRTTLITSTNRVYSIDEKSVLGDGRVDSDKLIEAAARAAKRLIAADFMELAVAARSVISASLFGAVAGSGVLPFPREEFEARIRAFGKGVDASLAAFAAGYDTAQAAQSAAPAGSAHKTVLTLTRRQPSKEELREKELAAKAAEDPTQLVGPALRDQATRIKRSLPRAAALMALRGVRRCALYQDEAYADRYLDRVARIAAVDPDADGKAALTTEAARWTALWMCYQDTIQVAAQKIMPKRLAGIRAEARAPKDSIVEVREFLHPQVEELADTMPSALDKLLRHNKLFGAGVAFVGGDGIMIQTTSLQGYTTLAGLAGLRPMRPRTGRFKAEQELIDAWVARVVQAAAADPAFAVEIVMCARVLKGYGATHAHGHDSFDKLMRAATRLAGAADAAPRLARLREAALQDEDGVALARALVTDGA